MAQLLPNGAKASVDLRKLEHYCLDPLHPRGRHKARVFREVLGVHASDASWLRKVLLQAARTGEATHTATDDWGDHWRMDVGVTRQGRSAVIRTAWLVPSGENVLGSLRVGCFDDET